MEEVVVSPQVVDVMLEIEVPYPENYSKRIIAQGSWPQFGNFKENTGIPLRWIYGNRWFVRFHVDDIPNMFSESLQFKFILEGILEENSLRDVKFSLTEKDLQEIQVSQACEYFTQFLLQKIQGDTRIIFRVECVWNDMTPKISKTIVGLR